MIATLIINCLLLMILTIVAIELYMRVRSLNRQSEIQEKRLQLIEKESQALLHADIIFGKSLSELDNLLKQIDNRQEMLENQRNNDSAYQHALRILQMGGGVEEIIEDCNLSQAEADLLANIHAYHTVNQK